MVCINDKDCGVHGSCVSISKEEMGKKHCECHYPYVNEINGDQHLPCSYIGLASTDMFYLSLFLGFFGIELDGTWKGRKLVIRLHWHCKITLIWRYGNMVDDRLGAYMGRKLSAMETECHYTPITQIKFDSAIVDVL